MKIQISLVFTSLVLLQFSAFGQYEFKILKPKQMQKDLAELKAVMEAHPDPYTKISEDDFNTLISTAEKNITVEMDEIDYFKEIATIISAIDDGHSNALMPKNWFKKVRRENGAFPYDVFLTNQNELYFTKSYGDKTIDLGAQIMSINDMSIEEFVNTIDPYISYETLPFRNDQISERFELFLYLVFKTANGLKFTYKVATESEAIVQTMPFKDWRAMKKDLKDEREKKIALGEPYDFNILKPGIAKIDIFSFAVPDFDKYSFFLDKTFKTIKKNEIHSLIIDVRGNYGGWPKVSSKLFHYIDSGHFKTMAKSSMKISRPYRDSYTDRYPQLRSKTYTFPQRRHFIDLQQLINGEPGNYVDESLFFNEAPIQEKHEFTGDCILLIDRKSYSASSSFASTFQCYTMGYIIGEPTGGTKIFRANAMTRVLPNSEIVIRMSTTKMYSACYNEENEPILPNIEVAPTIIDRVHDADPQLNTAIMLIKKIQKEREKAEGGDKGFIQGKG